MHHCWLHKFSCSRRRDYLIVFVTTAASPCSMCDIQAKNDTSHPKRDSRIVDDFMTAHLFMTGVMLFIITVRMQKRRYICIPLVCTFSADDKSRGKHIVRARQREQDGRILRMGETKRGEHRLVCGSAVASVWLRLSGKVCIPRRQ